MGRLDLPDTYRDEDFQLGGDDGNPGARQVPSPPAKGGDSSEGTACPSSGRPGAAPLALIPEVTPFDEWRFVPRLALEITPFGSQVGA